MIDLVKKWLIRFDLQFGINGYKSKSLRRYDKSTSQFIKRQSAKSVNEYRSCRYLGLHPQADMCLERLN